LVSVPAKTLRRRRSKVSIRPTRTPDANGSQASAQFADITESRRTEPIGAVRHHRHHDPRPAVVCLGREDAYRPALSCAPIRVREGNVGNLTALHVLRAAFGSGFVVDRVLR
jgi:hypothetical protein